MPVGIQAFIDTWKVQKALKITVRWRGYIPVGMEFGKVDKSEAETEEADIKATKYMMWALYPLMAGYVVGSRASIDDQICHVGAAYLSVGAQQVRDVLAGV